MKNIYGKALYLIDLIRYYPNWYQLLTNRIQKKNTTKVKLRNGLKISTLGKDKVDDLVYEVFILKAYTPKPLTIKKGGVVIDIGANIGVFGLMAAHHGATQIIEVEPLSGNIKSLYNNFKVNKFKKPLVIQAALSDKNGQAKLYLGDLDSHGLLFNRNATNDLFEKYIEVKTITLAKLFEQCKLTHCDFMKIDCEGSEGPIVFLTPRSIWDKIDKVSIEYHDNVTRYFHNDIAKRLKAMGFQVEVVVSDRYFGYIYAWK